MKKRFFLGFLGLAYGFAFCGCLNSAATHAWQNSPIMQTQRFLPALTKVKQGYFVLQGGGYWSHQGEKQHIGINGLIGDDFSVNKRSDGNGLAGLGYFLGGQDFAKFQLSYGVNGFFLWRTYVSGIVVQENTFSNLSYRYRLSHYPLYAVAKLGVPVLSKLPVAVDVGIGANFMRAGGFAEHSLDGGTTIPDNVFSSRTTTAFSATLGLNVQLLQFNNDKSLECGYRFFYLGEGRFQPENDQILNPLRTGSAYANAVLCAIHI